jgi:hypothetical protein
MVEVPETGSSIAIVSLHSHSMAEVAKISNENFCEYGKRWNYDVILYEQVLRPSRYPAWSKVPAILQTLSTNLYDWVFWIDCDSLFMNLTIPLQSRISEGLRIFQKDRLKTQPIEPFPSIIFASDFNGISTCSLFVRNCEWSKRFLEVIDFCGELAVVDPDGHGNKWEQNTVKHFIKEFPELASEVAMLPQEATNYHYHAHDFSRGGFILHFPVLSNEARVCAMKAMAHMIIR